MCLGIPMKLTAIDGEMGTVEEGGLGRSISLALLEGAAVGEYVIVHAGYAIERLDPIEAEETLALLRRAGLVVGETAGAEATADPAGDAAGAAAMGEGGAADGDPTGGGSGAGGAGGAGGGAGERRA